MLAARKSPLARSTRLLVLTTAALVPALSARAEDVVINAESKVSKVTVYADRALVERSAQTQVPAGVSRIAVSNLPESFDPNSLRARSGSVRVLGVDTERVISDRTRATRVEDARRTLEAAQRALVAAEMEVTDAKDNWERLRSIRATTTENAAKALGTGDGPNVISLETALDFISKKSAEGRTRLLAAQDQALIAKRAVELATRQFSEVSGAAGTVETRVIVTVTATAATDAAFTVQYIVGNASWTPVYDLRMEESFGAANLEMTGLVQQRTGEDWRGVPMELSTAQPAMGAAPPEPTSWIIDLYDPKTAYAERGVAAGAPMAKPGLAESKDAASHDDDKWQAPIRRSGLVVAFQSMLPATVASDGQPTRVALGRWPMAPSVRWNAFPRSTDKVFVTAKTTNTTGAALPGGEARVFVGPDFVGPMQLEDWPIGKEIDVGLGVDRDVVVARETLTNERATEGVFSKDTVHARAYRITMKNHRARPIEVRLLDQVPVSRDEDLKVVVTENSLAFAKLSAKDAETNKARGVLEWQFSLAPGQESEIRFAWRATHPQSKTMTGMDD